MIRVFLSHSSQDKFNYVEPIADALGRSVAIYDKVSFEAGKKTIREIIAELETSLIFVLFISDTALDSEWVRFEIEKAKELFNESTSKYFLPIIVDPIIAYTDSRIPSWLKDEYNLRYLKTKGALRVIQSKIREVSWGIKPDLKDRENIFQGRYEEKKKFSLRYYATDQPKPISCFASGLKHIGKLSFLKRCLLENRISPSPYYEYPYINLNSEESIENFIQYSLDLDIASYPPISNLISKTYEEKIEILKDIYQNLNNPKDIIAIKDNSCIIRRNGEVSKWFIDFIKSIASLNSVYFIISSESSPRNYGHFSDIIFWTKLSPLDKSEQKVLLVNYLESIYKLEVPSEEIETALSWVQGYPRQIFYLAQAFYEAEGSFAKLQKRSHEIRLYGAEFANMAIQKYTNDEKAKEILALMSCSVGIRRDFFIKAIGEDEEKIKYLDEFETMSFCHSAGSSNEYIIIDETLRDLVQRLRYKYNEKEYQILIEEIKKNLDDIHQNDVYSQSCYIEQQLIAGNPVDTKYILPSHFITAIKQSYHAHNNKHTIFLCHKLYESGVSFDDYILQIARFYECMAMIRENQDINGLLHLIKNPERTFLQGFSARASGNYKSALQYYKKVYEANKNYHYARNEYISLKIQMGDADEMAPIAKEEFDKNSSNIYIAQVYFNCLLSQYKKSSIPILSKEIERVLTYLPNVSDRKLNQIKTCMLAEKAFYIDFDIDEALSILEDYECQCGEDIYILFTKESILSYNNNFDEAQKVLDRIKVILRNSGSSFNDRIAKAQALIYARMGNYPAAEHVCDLGLGFYPQETKNRFLEYLYKVAMHRQK